MAAVLDIEKLLENPAARVTLRHNTGEKQEGNTWKSWIQGGFQVGLSASYTAPFEDMLEGITSLINKQEILSGGGISDFAESALGFDLESARTPSQYTYTWTTSDRPSFSVPLVFITTSLDNTQQGNPQAQAVSLAKLCLPGLEGGNSPTFTRPAGYTPTNKKTKGIIKQPPGTFTLNIGNWFSASGLVLLSAEIELSQQRMSNGWPLYAEVSVTLEPFRLISAEEFEGYFYIGNVPQAASPASDRSSGGLGRGILDQLGVG